MVQDQALLHGSRFVCGGFIGLLLRYIVMAQLDNFRPYHLDRPTLTIVFKFLPMSPMAQGNQIACCNRACNIAWRRMFYPFLCSEIGGVIENMRRKRYDADILGLNMCDVGDILGLIT